MRVTFFVWDKTHPKPPVSTTFQRISTVDVTTPRPPSDFEIKVKGLALADDRKSGRAFTAHILMTKEEGDIPHLGAVVIAALAPFCQQHWNDD